jgi:hypothetical protein
MTVARYLAVLAVLGVPALLAPPLAAARCRLRARAWNSAALLVCVVPLAAPWMVVGRARPLYVWLVAVAGGIVMLKAIDWLLRPRREGDLVRVWLALTVWPALQIEDVAARAPPLSQRIGMATRRLAVGAAGLLLGLALAALGQALDVRRRGTLVDSSLKCVEILCLAGGANHLMVGSFALGGYRVADAFRYPILARSVLDFWSRYNVWIHRWLKRNVFEPFVHGRRKPVSGILAVFVFSGLIHEYLVVPAAPQILGWQLAFFGTHGLGAIAGAWVGRRYRALVGSRIPRLLGTAATIGFVLLTAPIFMHCVDWMFDFHRNLGGWVLRLVCPARR